MRVTNVEPVPATPMQESLWWLHQRARNRSVYHLTWRMLLDRPLDEAALRVAWQAMVDRHEALRTSVVRRDETVTLAVAGPMPVDLGHVEISDPGPVDAATLLRLIAEEVHALPLEPDRAPLARLTLVRVGDRREVLLTVHHVVLDGWAVQLLVGELSAAYAAVQRGEPVSFPGEPAPFSGYARQQAAARADGGWDKSLAYWCETLDGVTATVLEPDLSGEAVSGAPGAILRYGFSTEAAAGLAALAKASFATPFAVLLAAMQIVLARAGAGSDVSIGVVTANRMTASDQALMGYTANLCLMRASVAGGDTVAQVVGNARDAMWQMLVHQAVPYPVVFQALPEATRTALGDTTPLLLSYLGPIGADLGFGEVPATLLPSPNRAARADLAMSAWEVADGYAIEVEYHSGRYRESSVLALLHDLDAVLADGGAEPKRTIGSFEVASRARGRGAATSPAEVHEPAGELPGSAGWRTVAAAWAQVLGQPPQGPDVDFFAVGGNSLGALRLAGLLDGDGTGVDLVRWLAEATPRRLVEQLAGDPARDPAGTESTLVTLREGPGTHLHLVHGAGGSPNDYQELVRALPESWRITASRDTTESTTVPDLARRYLADLVAAGGPPDLMGGWSFGGQIAYQMVADQAGPRSALVVLDATPPTGYALPPDPRRTWFDTFSGVIHRSLRLPPDMPASHTAVGAGDTSFDESLAIAALAAGLAAAGQPVPATLLGQRWRVYERHARANAAYVHPGPVDVPALVVGADLLDVQLTQWSQRLGATETRRVAAEHFEVLRAPAVPEVAAAIFAFARVVTARNR
ncbi:Phosphopantetheine attachment site [Actinoplanes regularis]|uniref:Phosphopantetheine attachment site n=1 Tax=Actinoplanes regularis TaxID=52697 RepID=A0A239HDR4_9ACTN|nr:hypothetical protein Are01nite_74480 [Actinoplanes regularis]SNS78394.1 Phosphopantetheine attachment site [Actinoplanes regularis]